jgi:hypothetical protein
VLLRAAALAFAIMPLVPVAARAQGDLPPVPKNLGALIGVVDDSLRGGRLIGATVTVMGTDRKGVTDLDGIFRIDSIVPGSYQMAVSHPLLDTLNLKVISSPFIVRAGVRDQVAAHTPTFEEVRAKSCTIRGVGGTSVLIGKVMQADSDEPAVNATVSLVFKDLTQKDAVERVRTGRVGLNGMFAICGLPATISGNLQASLGGVTTADLPLKMTDESLATAILSVGSGAPGTAVLKGVVKTSTGEAVAGAQVTVVGTTTVVQTSSDGSFTLTGLPSGTHEAVIRKIGFAKASQIVHLAAREPGTLNVTLDQATVLGTVHIVGKMDDGLAKIGFLSRKQMSRGWYLTPEQIAEKSPNVMSDLLRMTQGIRVVTMGSGRFLQSNSSAGSTKDGCINVFIDHARFDQYQPGDVDDAAPTADLGAIEFYSAPSGVPAEFTVPGKTCATLVIWTKTLLTTLNPAKP